MQSDASYIKDTIQKRKVIDMLVENAVFVDAPEVPEAVESEEKSLEEQPQEDKE